jgi:hypothetical protein
MTSKPARFAFRLVFTLFIFLTALGAYIHGAGSIILSILLFFAGGVFAFLAKEIAEGNQGEDTQ